MKRLSPAPVRRLPPAPVRRLPVGATLFVALAVAAMLALGWWQLAIRLPQKEAYLRQLAANPARPPVAFPGVPDDRLLFRRAIATCRAPVAVKLAGAGAQGFRAIGTCANGPIVQLGTTRDPAARVDWPGGAVSGVIGHVPDARPLIATLTDRRPTPLMLVSDAPAPGLARNAPPDLDSVPNNHLAYGVQWFFFAGVAVVIYALALRRRWTAQPSSSRP